MPGIAEEIDGAMQQAPQPERHWGFMVPSFMAQCLDRAAAEKMRDAAQSPTAITGDCGASSPIRDFS
jgi:hypothetical protein